MKTLIILILILIVAYAAANFVLVPVQLNVGIFIAVLCGSALLIGRIVKHKSLL
jgi:hypothetical protein